MENLFEQMGNIVKASNYDIVAKQRDELMKENERLKLIERSFYMDICRAYNAGKDNMKHCYDKVDMAVFISSHDYFTAEFPAFKTNVP